MHHVAGMIRLRATVGCMLLAGLFACSTDSLTPNRCDGPVVRVAPDQVTFSVGDTVLATAALIGPPECRPIDMTLRQFRWRSTNETVARVSALKGYIVAKDTGQTLIMLYIPADSTTWALIPVTVTPR
jgi:hypothetical protein